MTRPRSKQAHDKVLHAALDLFAERGIEAASMDAIAQASGVSKATIYNHWADKEALLLEVMELIHGLKREPEFVDTGNVCQDLTWVLTRRPPDEYDAQRAMDMGAVNAVVPHAELETTGLACANTILGKSPTAIRMLKYSFNLIDDGLVGQQLLAGEATRLAYGTEEAQEGRDAFVDKRARDFSRFPWHY